MKDQRGFTLLEMLLSMTLLSLLLVALFGGLRFMGRGSDRVEAVIEESQQLDLVRDVLTRQTANLYPLSAANKLLFTGLPNRLAFPILRLPGQGPAGLTLAVFDITNEAGFSKLIYREYPFVPGAVVAVADSPTRSSQLLAFKAPMSFRYRNRSGAWQEQWSDAANLPSLIAFARPGWPDLLARPRATPGPS